MITDERIDRYIMKQMSEKEEEEFEAFFLANPEYIEQLEQAQKLYDGMHLADQHIDVDAQPSPSKVIDIKDAELAKKWWQKSVPSWSIAATILVMLVPMLMFSGMQTPDYRPMSVSSIDIAGTRSSNEQQTTIGKAGQHLVLSMYIDKELATFDYDAFAFSFEDLNTGKRVIDKAAVELNQDDMIYANLNVVEAGSYRFILFGVDKNGNLQELKQHIATVASD